MRAGQGQELATRDEPVRREVYGEFNRIQHAEREAAESVTMLTLVNRVERKEINAEGWVGLVPYGLGLGTPACLSPGPSPCVSVSPHAAA